MLIHLVRKDFLIVKKYVLLMLAVCVFIPPFMMWRIDDATYGWFYEFYLSCNFFCFYAIAVCFIEGEPIRKSVYTTLCYTISPQTTCTFLNMFLAC